MGKCKICYRVVRACSNGCNIVGPTSSKTFQIVLCAISISVILIKVKVLNNNRLPWNVKQYAKEALY